MVTTIFYIHPKLFRYQGFKKMNPWYAFEDFRRLYSGEITTTRLMYWSEFVVRNGIVIKSRYDFPLPIDDSEYVIVEHIGADPRYPIKEIPVLSDYEI